MTDQITNNSKRKIQAILLIVSIIILVPLLFVRFGTPSFDSIESLPKVFTDCTSGQHVIVYHSLASDENITIGEVGLTWELSLYDEDENYRFYELRIDHFVSGAIGEGFINNGEALLKLSTTNQSVYQCSEMHEEGAVEVTLQTNNSWGGNIRLYFHVLLGNEGFQPQSASNVVKLIALIRTDLEANISFSLMFITNWTVNIGYGLFFIGTEKIVITTDRDIL